VSIVELDSFDIATASPWQFLSTAGFWASLPRLSTGLASARLLMVADTLDRATISRGFERVAMPEADMPYGVWMYRTQYEEHLRRSIDEVRFIRNFLVMDARMGDEGLVDLLRTYGLGARKLTERVPLPFETGQNEWRYSVGENGTHWGLMRSSRVQAGMILPRSLHRLFGLDFPIWAALHVAAFTEREAEKLLRNKAIIARYEPVKTQEAAQEAEEVLSTTARMRAEMHRAGATLHTLRFYVMVGGRDARELATRMEIMRGAVPFEMEHVYPPGETIRQVFSTQPIFDMEGAFLSSPGVALLTGSALSYRRRTETQGVLLGVDRNQAPVVFNIFDESSPSYNVVVLGQTGSGKTFAVLLMMLRHMLTGARLVIVDPQGNVDLSWLGEDVVHKAVIGTGAASINVLDIVHDELGAQIESVVAMLALLGIHDRRDAVGRALLDEALLDIYEPIWGQAVEPPTLAALQRRLEFSGVQATLEAVRQTAQLLTYKLNPYTIGSYAPLFGNQTTVDFAINRPVTIYDVSRLPAQETGGEMRAALLSILVGNVNQAIRRLRRTGDITPILFFVDEMGVLMRDEVLANHISAEFKTARARRVGMIVADQNLHTLLGPVNASGVHPGEAILFNSAYSFIFYQKDTDRQLLKERFSGMPDMMFESLFRLPRGVCVAQLPDDLLMVNVRPFGLEKIALSSQLHDRQLAAQVMRSLSDEAAEATEVSV